MRNKKKIGVIILPLMIVISVFVLKFWAQEECPEYTINILENFDTIDYKDIAHCTVADWPSGPITLALLGSDFDVTSPTGIGAKIYVCDAGDFDDDGDTDLVGLDIGAGDEPDVRHELCLLRNHFEDLDEDGLDDDGIIYQKDDSEVWESWQWGEADADQATGPAAITVADFNRDEKLDFFYFAGDKDTFNYDTWVLAVMYINENQIDDPNFNSHDNTPNLDFTDKFKSLGIYCVWSGDHLESVDIDDDNDVDLLIISEEKIFLMRNPGKVADAWANVDNWEITELNYDQHTGFVPGAYPPDPPVDPTYRGGSAVDAADFDGDGDLDIIAGTVNRVSYIVYYKNDGTGYFTRCEIPIPDEVAGTVVLHAEDFNNDGRVDIFGGNDRWNAGNTARLWFLENRGLSPDCWGIEFQFECMNDCLPIMPDPEDIDMSAVVDFDNDGDIDIVVADANHAGDYFLMRNDIATVYTTYGEAWSLNIAPALDPTLHAVTQVKINGIKQQVHGNHVGMRVEIWVSNNGRDWELYIAWDGNEIHPYPGGGKEAPLPHSFTHFGSQLRWKAILIAEEDSMEDYTNASFDTPQIDEINWQYTYIDQREYSRTSVVTTVDDEGEETKKLVIGGTFVFPGWKGYLRAYDVSEMALEDTEDSVLRTVSRPNPAAPGEREIIPEGVTIFWDAGEELASRVASSRVIYTATPVDSVLTRLAFTTDNVVTLGPILEDFNNDNEGLINFVRGEGRDWKLGDINHSNPVAAGPPDGLQDLKGTGYNTYKDTWEDRQKVLYTGANDGMLHCFNVLTGEELWAYIPYNLLPRLRDMWEVDEVSGGRYFMRQPYVDGSPVVEDVYIDVTGDSNKEWRTILVCGQGRGQGSVEAGGSTGNFYFALDVTDPANPQPLWEFTHDRMGETWSVPVIGKVTKGGEETWVAFMGSGYDNVEDAVQQGNMFYAIDLETGETFWDFDAVEVDTGPAWFVNIACAFPGTPSLIDTDSDGYTDRVYIGDLEGRMWKVDVTPNFVNQDSWSEVAIYEDSNNFPILTKPALWMNPVSTEAVPHLYFGTGGDDYARPDEYYSFIALTDGAVPEVEWYLGDQDTLGLPLEKDMGDFVVGEKVWADAKVADNVIYFSTLEGSIESVNPCENIAGEGRLYVRYVQAVAGAFIGGTALSGPAESLALAIKTRAAVTLGERGRAGENKTRKREVYIQEYDSTLQRLEQGVMTMLAVKSVREIFRIVR